jgi:hypothetical protein
VSASPVLILSSAFLPGGEKRVDSWIRSRKSTDLNELDARKPLMASVSRRSGDLRLYNLVKNLTISTSSFKAFASNAPFLSRTVRVF